MENLDLTLYTIIVAIAFITFAISTVREFNYMSKNDFKGELKKKQHK